MTAVKVVRLLAAGPGAVDMDGSVAAVAGWRAEVAG